MNNKNYIEEFTLALDKTRSENYLLPQEINLLGKFEPFRNGNNYEALYRLFIKHFAEPDGLVDLSKVRGQCLNYHTQIADLMKIEFGIDAILTIGYVNFFEEDFYRFEEMNKSLIRKLPNSNDRVIDIHVWLTLPSYEIIDLTFMPHVHYLYSTPEKKLKLRKATDFPYYFGSANFLRDEENIVFHPKYVGVDVLIKNGFSRF